VQIFELQTDLLKKLEKLVVPHSLGQTATFGTAWRCVWNATNTVEKVGQIAESGGPPMLLIAVA